MSEQEERRVGERREGWHTPSTCSEIINVKQTISELLIHKANSDIKLANLETKVDKALTGIEANAILHSRLEDQLNQNSKSTEDILDIIQSGKGFFKTMGFIGSVLKWFLGIATAILTFIFALKAGGKL